jgi:hypothetical protein
MQVRKLIFTLSESDRQGTFGYLSWANPETLSAVCRVCNHPMSTQLSRIQYNSRWETFSQGFERLSVRKQEVCGRGGYSSMVNSTQNWFWSGKFEKTLNLNSAHKLTQIFAHQRLKTQDSTQRTLEHKKEHWNWNTKNTREKLFETQDPRHKTQIWNTGDLANLEENVWWSPV